MKEKEELKTPNEWYDEKYISHPRREFMSKDLKDYAEYYHAYKLKMLAPTDGDIHNIYPLSTDPTMCYDNTKMKNLRKGAKLMRRLITGI